MTPYDRFLVALARFVLGLLARRFSTEHQRVWWSGVRTFGAQNRWLPADAPEAYPPEEWAGVVSVSFGPPDPARPSGTPPPLLELTVTRRMLDLHIDGAAEVRNRQDIQLQALRARHGGSQ